MLSLIPLRLFVERELRHYYRMAYNNLLLPPKSVAVILRKGVKGRKKNLMDQRTKQMVRLKAVEPSQFSRKFALEGCAELVISRERGRGAG